LTMALPHGPASSLSVMTKTPNSFCKWLQWQSKLSGNTN